MSLLILLTEFRYGRTNIRSMGKISNLPISMKSRRRSLPEAENPSTNDEVGPISPNPGPMFPKVLNVPLSDVIKSVPNAVSIKVPIITSIP